MEYKDNFKITDKETGKEYWVSRSMAVTGIILVVDEEHDKIYFLVEKRGPGCPDFVGYYCNPCGYLGYNETRKQAVIREIKEEIGLDYSEVNPDYIMEYNIMDDPEDNERQNVTTRYILPMEYKSALEFIKDQDLDSESRGGEANEVDEILLVSEDEIDNYAWAWNHGELLKEIVQKFKKEDDNDEVG